MDNNEYLEKLNHRADLIKDKLINLSYNGSYTHDCNTFLGKILRCSEFLELYEKMNKEDEYIRWLKKYEEKIETAENFLIKIAKNY